MNEAQQAACCQAMRWLARREYCRQELMHKLLHKGHAAADVEFAIDYVERNDCLNEGRYAAAYLRSRLQRGETPQRAAQRARMKGVDETVLHEAVQSILMEFDNEHACRQWLRRRDPDSIRHHDQRVKARLARFLCNKGFESSLVFRLLNSRDEDTDECVSR